MEGGKAVMRVGLETYYPRGGHQAERRLYRSLNPLAALLSSKPLAVLAEGLTMPRTSFRAAVSHSSPMLSQSGNGEESSPC